MVDYKYSELYKQDSVDKQLNIAFDGGEITNSDIHSEEFELTESLCSDSQLKFGSCEASMIKFRISNLFTPLKDKWLTVTETLNHNVDTPFQFGKYRVYSDTPTADRRYRDVVAYDKMYDIINTDLTEWYNSLFPTDDTEVTLKVFRDSLMSYLGVEQEDITLVNDDMIIKKTIQPTQLAGRDVVSAICEINGCFGHIGRDGKFNYVFLAKHIQGLYPANDLYPKDDLLPREQITNKIDKSLYIDCKYEDYLSQKITKIQIRQEENDIGKTYPVGETTELDNTYVVQGNFIVYGKEETELEDIAKKLYSVIYGTEYRPYEAQVVGNPCFEVGDAIRFNTSYQIVESYILKRTLSGVQGLRDELSADGEEYLSENTSGIESQIQQLKGKSNVLKRNIDETVSKISDVEQGLKSEIKQTADEIAQTVSSMQTKWDSSEYSDKKIYIGYEDVTDVEVTQEQKDYDLFLNSNTGILYEKYISGVVIGIETYSWRQLAHLSTIEENLSSQIEQTAESITSTVASSQSKWDTTGYTIDFYGYGLPTISAEENPQKIYLDQSTGKLYIPRKTRPENPFFWYNFDSLKLITDNLSSQIEQAQKTIVLKVDANGKIVEVSLSGDPESGTEFKVSADNISLTASEVIDMLTNGDINLTGKNISITSDNFNVDSVGNMSCENASVIGEVHATNFITDEKITIKSGWVFDDNQYRDVLYTEQELIGGRTVSLIHSYIDYIENMITVKGMLYAHGGLNAGVTTLSQLTVTGTKSRIASTKNYNDRLLYCYEMPSPLFGDIGHGITGYDGLCYVDIDSIFAETIDTIQQYYVFLQPYSDKPLYIKEKNENYFVVCGEPNTEFDWEIKAKQSDFPMERLEENSNDEFSDIDYVSSAEVYLENYEKELTING